jgi:hypothetical protein
MPVGRVKVFADYKADACSFLWVVKKGEAGRAVRRLHVLVEVRPGITPIKLNIKEGGVKLSIHS